MPRAKVPLPSGGQRELSWFPQPTRDHATATAGHESFLGNGTNPQEAGVYDLGPVGSRLAPGTHTLALIGLNQGFNQRGLHPGP